MKFGKFLCNYGKYATRLKGFNIGDAIQIEALELLYKKMHIPEEQVIELTLEDLYTWDGEYIIFPVIVLGIGSNMTPLPFSRKIIPIFISSHFITSRFDEKTISYLKKYEPIGCRDEYSLYNLERYGINCYLSGCITAIFPKQFYKKTDNKKVFLIDVPEEAIKKIPQQILIKSEKLTHLIPMDPLANTDEAAKYWRDYTRMRLKQYVDEAALIISSRLHAIAPCVAMGIPAIALTENCSQRFGWLDRYLPIYTTENMDEINWTPQIIDYEKQKEKIIQMMISEIQAVYNKWHLRYEVSDYYESRTKSLYGSHYYYILRSLSINRQDFDYIIWGCGLNGESTYGIMQKLYPEANLIVAVDSFVEGNFQGRLIMKPDVIKKYSGALILLCSYSGKDDMFKTMQNMGKIEGRDFVYLGTQNG